MKKEKLVNISKSGLLTAVCAAMVFTAFSLDAQRTTRSNLRYSQAAQRTTDDNQQSSKDALTPVVGDALSGVSVKGYDKPLRSRRETLFVTNNMLQGDTIQWISFTVTYLDKAGRMLHKESRSLPCNIPAKQTRQLSMKSWDVQNNFYYQNSAVPVRAEQATPYSVSLSVDTVFIASKNQ